MPEEEPTGAPDLDDVLGSDAEFSLDDDGEIQITGAIEIVPDPAQSTEETPPVTPDPAATPIVPAGEHDYEARYKNLEPEFTRKSQRLAELEKDIVPQMREELARMQGQIDMIGGDDPDGDEDDRIEIPDNFGEILMQDPMKGVGMIAEIADRVAARQLIPILERVAPMLEDYELESELRSAAMVEGREDFFELLPQMRDIINRGPTDLTFDEAYELAKTVGQIGDPVIPTPAAPAQPVPVVPATDRITPEEAQQNADRLAPEPEIVSGEVAPTRRVVDSVDDAFNQAVEDLYGP